jgi:hypothetical protein
MDEPVQDYTMYSGASDLIEKAVRFLRRAGAALGAAREATRPYANPSPQNAARTQVYDNLGSAQALVLRVSASLTELAAEHASRRARAAADAADQTWARQCREYADEGEE